MACLLGLWPAISAPPPDRGGGALSWNISRRAAGPEAEAKFLLSCKIIEN